MGLVASSFLVTSAHSLSTGRELAGQVCQGRQEPVKLVLTYLTLNHDQAALLQGMREVLGDHVGILGCSAQGEMGRGYAREEGYAAGAMALGGEGVLLARAVVEPIASYAYAPLGTRILLRHRTVKTCSVGGWA